MKRIAHQIIRWGLVTTGSCLASAAGYDWLCSSSHLPPAIRAEGLQRVSELPRLLALPQDVVPVGLDFVPPLPQVENAAPVASPQTSPAPQRFEAEPQPHGFYNAQNPKSRIARLPQVSPVPASGPRRDTAFVPAPLVERSEFTPVPHGTAATTMVQEHPTPPPVHVEKRTPEKVQQPLSPLAAVNERASAQVAHAAMLADRGALFTARAEFIQALRMITQGLDAQYQTTAHSQALAAGLKALEEANDFAPTGSRLEADLDLPSIIAGHRTPILKNAAPQSITALTALQRYYAFAQEQLSLAARHEPAASQALYGLGKLTTVMAQRSPEARRLHGPKAIVLYQTALAVNGGNSLAAHELGAMLAQFGQWQEAKQALLHGIAISGSPAAWHNLAVVHDRLGEADMAAKARNEMNIARRTTGQSLGAAPQVEWLDPTAFAQTSPENQRPSESPAAESAKVESKAAPPSRAALRPSLDFWKSPWLK